MANGLSGAVHGPSEGGPADGPAGSVPAGPDSTAGPAGAVGGGLRLDGIGRRYGLRGPWVLRGVTLEAPPGSLIRVEGPNGSGKSTLLRIAAGVDRPSAGRVAVRPATGTAYVPERFPPALPFPVLRYLTHLGAVRGLTAEAARERALHWLERFGITGYAHTPLRELSKGTCQKVAVAQALMADPGLLVLDEAWTGLDEPARDILDEAVRERLAAGATVVFVDHDPRRLADEAALVHGVGTEQLTRTDAARPERVDSASASTPEEDSEGAPRESGGVVIDAVRGDARRRLVVPAPASDEALRGLLGEEPPWHITAVRSSPPRRAPAGAVTAPAVRTGVRRRTAAVLAYQAELLARSHRWLPPLLFYAAVMAIGIAAGEPLLGSLGYAAALLLPVAAWAVRVCVTNEPAPARACVASAVGARTAHRCALVTALVFSAALGAAGTAVVVTVSGAYADDLHTPVPTGPAAVAGLMAAAVSVLLGTTAGALTNPPPARGGGWSVLLTALVAGGVLLTSGSPAQAAVSNLVTGSHTGTVHFPVVALAAAALIAAVVLWLAPRATGRRG